MMNNLFSIFDTSTSMMWNLNWLSSILNMLILPMMFWLMPSKLMFLINKIYLMLFNELKTILNNKFNFFNSIFFISLFLMIFLNNILGLFPYIFTSSSHMIFSLSISLSMWISMMMFYLMNNLMFFFSHLIPSGTPNMLMPFMVLIESISNIIRPGTLAIRLTANMIAGHLLLTLLSESANSSNFFISLSIIFIQIILLILEFSVSIIQSYVFMILSTLYLKETN
uniref:ATP synthase subunit a n=1 Tax=Amblyjoppa sp. ZJUH_2016002 TaxID=2491150 RepID=A0A3S8V097_9HYME|nr:ATP synthase F0 subunit 6 [Amblyjoppa sp. ZJUH_2016002]